MKVAVLTIADVQIANWRWWSNWIDIAVFDFGYCGFLLQMKVSRCNAKKFKAIPMKARHNIAYASINEAGDLIQMEKKHK